MTDLRPGSTVPGDLGWELRGAAAAASLVNTNAIAVVGDDPVAAAQAALGIARAESARRRVAVADLVGDVAPLQSLVTGDDPHGVVDSFLYGVSLNRVAQPVDASGQLFVIQTGTEPVLTEEIFRSDRWRRLAAGFREAGALLILVAPASAPGLEDLVAMLDGAVVVGSASLGASTRVLGVIPEPAPDEVLTAGRRPITTGREPQRGATARASRPWLTPVLLGILVLGIGASYLFRGRDEPRRGAVGGPDTSTASIRRREQLASAEASHDRVRDSIARDSARAAAMPATLAVENPADSARAAVYGVAIMAANTQAGAEEDLDLHAFRLPAVNVTPVVSPDNVQWYRLSAGAYAERRKAEWLRGVVQRTRPPGSVKIVRSPLALLVERGVRVDSVALKRRAYAARGARVYALRQPDGSVNLYAGAFESPEQSAVLADMLRGRGLTPTLVYRTGSPI